MNVETSPAAVDLPEVDLELEVPCGGNLWPVKRACPGRRAAIVRKVDGSCSCRGPASFKCLQCYTEWARAFVSDPRTRSRCCICGARGPSTEVRYVPL